MLNITAETKYDYRILNHLEIIRDKIHNSQEYDCKLGVLEFHPTNQCNLWCTHCTYKYRNSFSVFPFERLEELKRLDPKALVLSGGGEPTVYSDNKKNFNDLVLSIRSFLPNAKIGLTTNGQVVVHGKWINEMDWIRISIDTVDERKFRNNKGGSLSACFDSLKYYLMNSTATIGVGFIYNNGNLGEIERFNRKIYSFLLQENLEQHLYKINIQYRPTCQVESCMCPSMRYIQEKAFMVSDMKAEWKEREKREKEKIFEGKDERYIEWLKNVTNLDLDENSERLFRYNNSPIKFKNCYYALVRNMLTATGELYPCVVKATNNSKPIGNILFDTDELIFRGQECYYSFSPEYCQGCVDCCRFFAKRNAYAEEALAEPDFQVPDYLKDSDFM